MAVAEREGLRQASCPRESRYLAEASVPGFTIVLRWGPRSLQVCQLFSPVKQRCKELEPKTESMQRIPMPTARTRSQLLPLSAEGFRGSCSQRPLPCLGGVAGRCCPVAVADQDGMTKNHVFPCGLIVDQTSWRRHAPSKSQSPAPRVVMHARQLFRGCFRHHTQLCDCLGAGQPDPPPRLGSPASQHIVSSLDSWFVCVAAD